MEAAMLMMRQAADLRAAWYSKNLTSVVADHLLWAWIEIERRASRAMLEAIRPIGVTW